MSLCGKVIVRRKVKKRKRGRKKPFKEDIVYTLSYLTSGSDT
jgi:hypothetical protein